MKNDPKPKTIIGAISVILCQVDNGLIDKSKLDHVVRSILALSENPDAVTVNTSLLDEVCRKIDWYLKVENGFLLILLGASYWSKKLVIQQRVAELGVDPVRIRLIQPALNMKNAIEAVNSRQCRLVLYSSKDCPKRVLDQLLEETSIHFSNPGLLALRKSLTLLS